MSLLTKAIRVQIIKPIDTDWNTLGEILRDFSYETYKVKNRVIQYAWEWNGFQLLFKQENGNYPKDKDYFGKTLANHIYNELKDKYFKWNSGVLGQTIRVAIDRFNTDKKEILRGDKSIASFRRGCPIELRNSNVKISEDNNGFIAELSLLSREYNYELFNRKNGGIPVALFSRDNSTSTILRRINNGEYKIGASKIVRKGSKWFLNISYSFDNYNDKVPKNNDVMGIDLGVVYAAYVAFNKSKARYSIKGGEITEFRRRVENRRIDLLQQGKYCGEGRKGHGRSTRLKPIEKLTDKVANFRDTTNHRYSRYIVDLAVKHGVSVIQMEDLSGIRDRSKFLATWSYHDLQEKITYKAKEHGIEVIKISPKYTSQRCHKCGHIEKSNRKEEVFKCKCCGNECHADYNAAKNISTPGIEEIIANEIGNRSTDTEAS